MELHFRETGSGPALIILHGLFGMSDNFASVAKELGRDFHVFVVDQRNHGGSGHSPVFNYESMSDDLLGFIELHGLEKAFLLGHSMGGKTAMRFAFDHPEKVDRLIVADISPAARNNRDQHQGLIDIMLGLDLSGFNSRVDVAYHLEDKVPSFRLRQFLLKNLYWKDKTTLGWKINLEVINKNLEEIFSEVRPAGVFSKPTLFLKGEFSDYIRQNDLELIRTLFSNVVFETIAGANHWLHADNPAGFIVAVRNFLNSKIPEAPGL